MGWDGLGWGCLCRGAQDPRLQGVGSSTRSPLSTFPIPRVSLHPILLSTALPMLCHGATSALQIDGVTLCTA